MLSYIVGMIRKDRLSSKDVVAKRYELKKLHRKMRHKVTKDWSSDKEGREWKAEVGEGNGTARYKGRLEHQVIVGRYTVM